MKTQCLSTFAVVLTLCLMESAGAAPASALAPPSFNTGLGSPPDAVDRESPLSTVHGFLNAAHAGNYALAAHYLDLASVPSADQAIRGATLARRLKFVLDKNWLDLSALSREMEGDKVTARTEQLGSLALGRVKQPIRLTHISPATGWVFSKDTVKSIDKLFDVYGPPLAETLPDFYFRHAFLQLEPWQWMGILVVILAAGVLALAVSTVTKLLIEYLSRNARHPIAAHSDSARGATRLFVASLTLLLGAGALDLTPTADALVDFVSRSLLMFSIGWLCLVVLNVTTDLILSSVADHPNGAMRLRSLRTQLAVMRRIVVAVVYVVTTALLLVQIPQVRHVGISLLASAGLAGLVLGFAAQKSISTLVAGIQLTVTQPIRIGDTVVVEGESGIVEELTLTFVTIKLWDLRRLVLPMTYFLEKPFQNWSKGEDELSASVTLRTSRTADISAIRAEVDRILHEEGRPLWDGKLPNFLVNEVSGEGWALRILVGPKQLASSFALPSLPNIRSGIRGALPPRGSRSHLPLREGHPRQSSHEECVTFRASLDLRTRLHPEGGGPHLEKGSPHRVIMERRACSWRITPLENGMATGRTDAGSPLMPFGSWWERAEVSWTAFTKIWAWSPIPTKPGSENPSRSLPCTSGAPWGCSSSTRS